MPASDLLRFLKKNPPFSFLDEASLITISTDAMMEFYPKESTILHQHGPVSEFYHLIHKGEVRIFVRSNEGEEILIDYRSDGGGFGLLSLLCGDISRDTVVATEDTTCYLIRKETMLRIMKESQQFSEFFYQMLLKRLVNMTYKEIQDRTLMYGGGDKLLFTNTLGDLASKKVITAPEDTSIQEAAGIMLRHKISALVLLDRDGLPSGLITDRDLRNKVVAKGRDTHDSVKDIMSVTIIKSEMRDYCFEALLKMIRYRIHHMLVVNKGELRGIITNHDLMMLQGTSPLSIAREIEDQETIDGLIPVSKKISRIITVLIKEGARASNITRIITEINDRLIQKVLDITETRLGPAPIDYCWIVYGSEGRKEQTFKTDQDNALIYEDPQDSDKEAVNRYFSEFGLKVKDALNRCGFPPCSADYMASNPKWCQPLSVWKKYFSAWINQPTPQAVLLSLIFFDFRPLYGNYLLAEKLRAFLGHEAKSNHLFHMHMAAVTTKNRPPRSLWGNLKVEKNGPHKDTFNMKLNALCPIADTGRLLALDRNIYQTSTIERLRGAKEQFHPLGIYCDDLVQAFEYLMSLRLAHQLQQIEEGREPDNFINPGSFGKLQREFLNASFKLISLVQEETRRNYNVSMTS